MGDRNEKSGTFILSAIGCFVLAVLLLALGWWMFSALLALNEDMDRFGSSGTRRGRPRGGWVAVFGILGLIIMLGGLVMSGIGVAVIWKGMFGPKPKGEAEDTSWRNMPAPSDAPKNGRPIPPPPRRR